MRHEERYRFAPPGTELALRLEPNRKGRDLVVGDVHGYFETLRQALRALEMGPHDRILSLGDLIDRGPESRTAKRWMAGRHGGEGFDLVIRGNHEQLMLNALQECPEGRRTQGRLGGDGYMTMWESNGGWWWKRGNRDEAPAWRKMLERLPVCARVETEHGAVGLVHAEPAFPSWTMLEADLQGREPTPYHRALWSRVRDGHRQREIGEDGTEWQGSVHGVRCVITGHTPREDPRWHENVLGIDTGVHIDRRDRGRLTVARIDGPKIEWWCFPRIEEIV